MKAKIGNNEFEGTVEEIASLVDRLETRTEIKPSPAYAAADKPPHALPSRIDWNASCKMDVAKFIRRAVRKSDTAETMRSVTRFMVELASVTYGTDMLTLQTLHSRALAMYYWVRKRHVTGKADGRKRGHPNHLKGLKLLKRSTHFNYEKLGINLYALLNRLYDAKLDPLLEKKEYDDIVNKVYFKVAAIYGDKPKIQRIVRNRVSAYASYVKLIRSGRIPVPKKFEIRLEPNTEAPAETSQSQPSQ